MADEVAAIQGQEEIAGHRDSRPLSVIENACRKLDKGSPFNVVISATLEGECSERSVAHALEAVRRRHPYLRYVMSERDGLVCFVACPEIEIPLRVFHNSAQHDWECICKDEMNTPVDMEAGPPVRCSLIRTGTVSHLVVTFSHVVSDGVSAFGFVSEVLYAIPGEREGKEGEQAAILDEIYPDFDYLPVLPAPDSLHGPDAAPAALGGHARKVTLEERRSGLITSSYGPEQTRAVASRCAAHGVTVNSFLASAMVLVFREYVSSKSDLVSTQVKCSSGINLRPYLVKPVTDRQLGMWSGFGYVYFELSEVRSLWETARVYGERLHAALQAGKPLMHLRDGARASQQATPEQIARTVESPIPYLLLTNLGRREIDSRIGGLRLKKVHVMTPMHRNWADEFGFGLCALTCNGRLSVSFVYPEPAMSRTMAGQLIQEIDKIIVGGDNG